jgi:cobalamin synthase
MVMDPTFLGFPFYFWAILCAGVAALYAYLWPRPKPGQLERPLASHLVLRWFHSLTWVLLALACLAWGWQANEIGQGLASLALIVYLVFAFTLLWDRRSRTE